MVYGLNIKPEHGYYVKVEALDGDLKTVTLLDETPDEGLNPRGRQFAAGRAVDPTHMPTRMKWCDQQKHPIPDFDNGLVLNVSARAKALIEQFEPDVHQFLPVEYVDIEGDFLENRWFLIVCNRVDTVDREHTQGMLLSGGKMWRPAKELLRKYPEEIPLGYDLTKPIKIVFNLERIGSACLWCDKHFTGGEFISSKLANALEQGGFTGLRLEFRGH